MIVQFTDRAIDFDRVEIRGPDGPVPVQPQVFSLIEYLIDHRDRVVPQSELMDELWGDRFVSDSAITSRVKFARRALGDDGARQAVIRTVQGRGYRFVAEIAADSADIPADVAEPPTVSSAPAPAPAPADPPEHAWPLVGRAEELATVWHARTEGAHGVLVDGEGRVGRSHFLREIARVAAIEGDQVLEIRPTGSELELSAMGHLLPAHVFDVSVADDLARGQLFRQAVEAIGARVAKVPTVLIVDDVDRLDTMSSSVVEHVVRQGLCFAVVSPRADAAASMAGLADEGLVRRVHLRRLDEADVDAALYRVLSAPLDRTSLRRLWEISEGLPGVLNDLVETSRRAGSLQRVDGVWHLTGGPLTSSSAEWPTPELSDRAIRGAERLALVRRLAADEAAHTIGDDALDELDRAGLLRLVDRDGTVVIALADELLLATVANSVPPLTGHRLRTELAAELAAHRDPEVLATVVEWGPEFAAGIDPLHRLLAAVTAMQRGDVVAAERLSGSLDHDEWPAAAVLQAEIDVQHGRHDRAEQLLDELDVDGLDDLSKAIALRRRASLEFGVHHRHDESLTWLDEQAADLGGAIAPTLAARRVGLLAYLGRYHDVLAAAAELVGADAGASDLDRIVDADLPETARLEILLACASALGALGGFDASLAAVDHAERFIAGLPPAWSTEPSDHALTLRVGGLMHLGRLDDAVRVAREHVAPGQVSAFGFLPSIAADAELCAGRPRAAREVLRPASGATAAQAFPQYVGLTAAMLARAERAIGGSWQPSLELALEQLEGAAGGLRRRVSLQLAELAADLESPEDLGALGLVDLVERNASDAEHAGALLGEMELRCMLVAIDPTPATARRFVDRIDGGAGEFDGPLWEIRRAHVRARAGESSLDDVEQGYRALGYELWADRAARGR